MNSQNEIKKFSEAEMLLGGFFTLFIDVVSALIDATGIGLAIAPFLQSLVTFVMWVWFKSKGDKTSGDAGKQVAKYAANILPIVPTTFIVFVVSVYLHNHPKKVVQKNTPTKRVKKITV